MIKENNKAPIFKLPSTSKNIYSLKDSFGKYIVIYFYPKDDTPGCTLETNDFNKLLPNFKKLNCEILGISKDNIKSHDKFREKYKNVQSRTTLICCYIWRPTAYHFAFI